MGSGDANDMYKVAVIARSFGGVKTPPYSTDR